MQILTNTPNTPMVTVQEAIFMRCSRMMKVNFEITFLRFGRFDHAYACGLGGLSSPYCGFRVEVLGPIFLEHHLCLTSGSSKKRGAWDRETYEIIGLHVRGPFHKPKATAHLCSISPTSIQYVSMYMYTVCWRCSKSCCLLSMDETPIRRLSYMSTHVCT